jgi:outer membrane protein assembly factor BamA
MDPNEVAREKDRLPEKEFSLAAGFKQVLDFRNIPENPSLGWHEAFRLFQGFPYAGPVRKAFTVVDSEIQMYQYLVNRDLVLASGLAGGVIFGEAPYLSQFRLGGTDRLRGFFYDRFRGSKYYVQQNELRFPILSPFSGATFLEFGEVTEKHFNRAHVSYGLGLRIGIPPDEVSKFRIDYAMSADQKGIFVDFGHAF